MLLIIPQIDFEIEENILATVISGLLGVVFRLLFFFLRAIN